MKAFFLLFPLAALLAACAGGPKTVSELSREEAIRLYNGEIAETEWLAKLNVVADSNAVKLADGFLFYETKEHNGEKRIINIVLPADAPTELKSLARSLRTKAEPTKEIHLKKEAIWLDGNIITEEQLCAEARRLQTFPRSRRPHCRLLIDNGVDAEIRSRVSGILKKSGIVIEPATE